MYEYDGPLVVLTKDICDYAGETEPSNYCPICHGLYKRVNVHMRTTHRKIPEIKKIEEMENEKDKNFALDKLSRRANFQHNIRCITEMKGLIFPTRRSKHFRDNRRMIHTLCCLLYLERRHYNRHMRTCREKDIAAPGTLALASLHQKDL